MTNISLLPCFVTDSGWTPIPAQIPANCPSGLYPLLGIDHLFVKQKIELLEGIMFNYIKININVKTA